jgi:LAO/AO transport system kinase
MMPASMLNQIKDGDMKALSRGISIIANETSDTLLSTDLITSSNVPVIGITGPPGAGKSTLTDRIIEQFVNDNKKVAVLCIDPSSPFTKGAILGDRIRMSQWYNEPRVFIRSMATRGSLGGLPPHAGSIVNLLKSAPFDFIVIETVGVGQNEVQIISLADVTVVVLVPEGGDEIQFMKAGLMEIADIFVVNKSDRPGADHFANDIKRMLHNSEKQFSASAVIKTIANTNIGVGDVVNEIYNVLA